MRRLIIIVEGDTEKEFIDRVLSPYFYANNYLDIRCHKIKHSGGGLSKYSHLKTDIIHSIYQPETIITTLIDFYALPKDFPMFEESKKILNKLDRVSFLEQNIKDEIERSQNRKFENFIPYIQLHEFEALVFSSVEAIYNNIENSKIDKKEIDKIFANYSNPEDINDDPNTAPSKRLKKYIKGYNKIIDGIAIIEEQGLSTILNKCPRFKSWMEKVIST